ncbi:MAG: penicillin-binding transpeptidase domain-containing protein, partial [Myxococcota bacterium]
REILAQYLTFIPFGRNIEGVTAASLAYFGHDPGALSASEIAILLAVPQRPNQRYPHPRHRARLQEARNQIALRLLQHDATLPGGLQKLEEVKRDDVPTSLRAFPREAPHFSYWLRARHPKRAFLRSTLDQGAQRVATAVLHKAGPELRLHGVHHGAIVVADPHDQALRAVVGGLDFFREEDGAQIASFDTPRSPGSTLKPLLYAMAIDEGRVLPGFVVPDVPVQFGTYVPRNYDEQFSGLVRLSDALAQSLNVPFVNLLAEVGLERFLAQLRHTHVESLHPGPGHYGLSAIVGGLALTPLELTQLYSSFATGGIAISLRSSEDDGRVDGHRILSAGSVALLERALRDKDRPDFPERRQWSGVPAQVRWKTGTSFGHRDAWSAGYDDQHVAVVWLGNMNHVGSAHLVGAQAAGPLLFDVLEGIGQSRGGPATSSGEAALRPVEVCAWSGHIPNKACPRTHFVDALPDRVPQDRCAFHQEFSIDLDTGERVSPLCRHGRSFASQTFLVLPSELRRWLRQEQRALPSPPRWAAGCAVEMKEDKLHIASPEAGAIALLVPGLSAAQQEIPFRASAGPSVTEVSWFVDGAFLGTVGVEDTLWWRPTVGTHNLVVSDASGRTSAQTLEVVTAP